MHTLQMLKEQEPLLARSQLYSLAPMGMRTVWVESLTSYIHRLAAKYKVKPRAFVTEVMLPHLVRWHETRPSFTTTTGGFYGGYLPGAQLVTPHGEQMDKRSTSLCCGCCRLSACVHAIAAF